MYILNTELNLNNYINFELQNVYGIGKFTSFNICKKLGFSSNLKVKDLSEVQKIQLLKLIENSNLILTSELKKLNVLNLKKSISIKSYKGLRKLKGLPVRGQRTHTNAKTSRKIKKF